MGTLQHIEHQISALNDLIKINNDRIEGYQKASDATTEENLKKLFAPFMQQSRDNVSALQEQLHILGGTPAVGTTLGGKFYHAWIGIKSIVSSPNRESILFDCERGEDVAKTAYRMALDDKELIWEEPNLVKLLIKQFDTIKTSHDAIKALREKAT